MSLRGGRILPVLALLLAPPLRAEIKELTAKQLVDKANELFRGDSSHADVSMTVQTTEWSRELKIESWNRGREKAMIVVHAPAKDRGNSTLRAGSEMWTWLPNVERVVKIPPTMMHSAWMGSDFTYEDIVKADSIVRDYVHTIVKREKAPGYEEVTIQCLPKEDAPVVWGKVFFKVRQEKDGDIIPVSEEDYSERGELVRTIQLSEVEAMGGRRLPTKLKCLPERKKGQSTTLKYRKIEFGTDLPDSFFSLKRLQGGLLK